MPETADRLTQLIDDRAGAAGITWLKDALALVAAGQRDIRELFPAAGRKVGRAPLEAGDAELSAELAGHRYQIPLAAWRLDDAARVLLLMAEASREPDGVFEVAGQLYRHGDSRERIAAARALAFLGDSDTGLPIVLDAMRTNDGALFEAAICDNAYASAYLPTLEFRKAVLKCLFIGHTIGRVLRLSERVDSELAGSLLDYVHEREAATRSVPSEVWPVMAMHPPAGLSGKLLGYVEHPDPEHRRAAAVALGRMNDERVRSFLADRTERETNHAVQAALRDALER